MRVCDVCILAQFKFCAASFYSNSTYTAMSCDTPSTFTAFSNGKYNILRADPTGSIFIVHTVYLLRWLISAKQNYNIIVRCYPV